MLHRTMFLLSLCGWGSLATAQANEEWWRDTFIYQIYPRSFKDSNGDGIGDLNGITSKLEHFVDMGISIIWISPFFVSPMIDFGYDIANFTDIDPIFGSLDDFINLMEKAKRLGLRVILDFVPNHSSDLHPWFLKSVQKIKPYDEYYIWKDAKIVNGTRQPPNNWLSCFQGSAWEWNAQRGQYFLHQFTSSQPDLNFRSPALQQEMKDVLQFWLDRGVDGFRVDAAPHLLEDTRFLDEPVIPNTGLPPTDPKSLDHIYSLNQPELYDVIKSWTQLLNASSGDRKVMLVEVWTTVNLTMQYYLAGANLPMNFMLMFCLTNTSTNVDFKENIARWLDNMPRGDYVANWVSGTHDNHRVASRLGTKRADQLSMLSAILPGVGIIYNGDEIGMEDLPLTWEQTVDPAGRNAGLERYQLFTRDPARTPYQWDNTTSAGFSSSNRTWLPVNPNYMTLNLQRQKMTNNSHYSVFKRLVRLKKEPRVMNGSTELILVGSNVLGVVRRLQGISPAVLLINFSNDSITIDASTSLNVPEELTVYVSSVDSNIPVGTRVNGLSLTLPGAATVIFT